MAKAATLLRLYGLDGEDSVLTAACAMARNGRISPDCDSFNFTVSQRCRAGGVDSSTGVRYLQLHNTREQTRDGNSQSTQEKRASLLNSYDGCSYDH